MENLLPILVALGSGGFFGWKKGWFSKGLPTIVQNSPWDCFLKLVECGDQEDFRLEKGGKTYSYTVEESNED